MPHHQPTSYPTLSPYMMVSSAQHLIDFVTDVLGGQVVMRMERDDGSTLHGALRIGDSVVMFSDATEGFRAFPVWLHVYVPNVDATYRTALEKGGTSVQEPSEQGDGDRRAGVKDRAGNTWWIATHVGL